MRMICLAALIIVTTCPCFAATIQANQDASSSAGVGAQSAPWRARFGPINPAAASSTSAANSSDQTVPSETPGQQTDQPGVKPNQLTTTKNSRLPNPAQVDSTITKVTRSFSQLPNDAGQVWREYDISPYTSRVNSADNPQQAILDWIRRETGTEMWFNAPMGILSADKNAVYVYHTPEIQQVVKNIIDRFVNSKAQVQVLDLNLVTVENPNWRTNSYWMLQPIEVQSPGAEAWMVSKENAAQLLSLISQRRDFKDFASGRMSAHDGQQVVLEKKTPRQFVQNLRWVPGQLPNFQPQMTRFDEGYKLSLSCLTTLNSNTIEATIRCEVDQIERLKPVRINVPAANGGAPTQMDLQIPQIVSWRLQERFRWPNDQVLLLSCGVVASPDAGSSSGNSLPRLFNSRRRADALLFIDFRGPANGATRPSAADNQTNLVPVNRR